MINFECIKNMDIDEMSEVFGSFVWSVLCNCDEVQQNKCKFRNNVPAGGCSECVKNNTKEWLGMETLHQEIDE